MVITSVNPSVIGATNHTPVIPKNIGKINIHNNKMTNPLDAEIIADSLALPIEVKKKEDITLTPENKNEIEKIVIPDTISSNTS